MEKQVIVNESVSISLDRYHELIEAEKQYNQLKKHFILENKHKFILAKDMVANINKVTQGRCKILIQADDVSYAKPIRVIAAMDPAFNPYEIIVQVALINSEEGYTLVNSLIDERYGKE